VSRPSRIPAATKYAAAGIVVILVAALAWRANRSPNDPNPATPSPTPPAAYVDNKVCLGCHLEAGRQWQTSHHAQAMAAASAESVLGDFSNRTFTHRGVTSRFFKRGAAFFVNTEGGDGKHADFQIRYTFGVAPLQQYLVELPGGRLQPLTVAWDQPRQRWFHLLPNEKTPPGDVLHWTGRYQNANTMCLVCHTTDYEKRYDAAADTFASRWAEPTVSCQSCHGPGSRHVDWETNQRGAGPSAPRDPQAPRGLTVDLRGADAKKRTELCAPCHSRRSELTPRPAPGEPHLDNFLPSLLVEGLYHADGQQLDEVYVDASFRQSLMHQRGVTCTDCHNPHTGKLNLPGNSVCLQCHRPDPASRFPTAAGNYDSPAHHFHKDGSTGARCVTCHMAPTTYMQIQPRPDHSIRIPRPDLSAKLKAPDACTQCHTGKTPSWAAEAIARWYGPTRRQGSHYGEAFALARVGEPSGYEALAALVANRSMPSIVRASALAALRPDPVTGAAVRVAATHDPDAEVRAAAADSLDGLSASERLTALGPLLSDPVRAVRITAARALSSTPVEQMEATLRPRFDAALAEYIAAQEVSLDMPGAQFNLAIVYENTGRRDQAERHYQGVLRIDPDFTPARANLAQLYAASARNADAERVLADGLKRLPELGELQYSLGLLLAEDPGRMKESAEALTRAAKLLPTRSDVHYNLGLALEVLGQNASAEQALLQSQRLNPNDPQIAYALAIFYSKTGRSDRAIEWAEKLRELRPMDPQIARLVETLRAKR
jgi:predicted CXXCH cytochrome family protein